MLLIEHGRTSPKPPARVVVLGAGGFVGGASALLIASRGIPVKPLGRSSLDLLADDAADRLRRELAPGDALVVVSAAAPCRNAAMLVANIRMMAAVADALAKESVAQVVYVSSDAVYRDSREPLIEESCAEPASLHGAMHLSRELMLKDVVKAPLAILRPSLLYGAADPHNGYGPNRFRRQAAAGDDILLFGEGEERRDHVLIDDVAELVYRVIVHESRGILNIATGEVHSFRDIAERIAGMYDPRPGIRGLPRQGPMPHGGYRAFDVAACRQAFPDFRYTGLAEGLARTHRSAR
jgi:nucleoside-diphosphate-sugar epimerase